MRSLAAPAAGWLGAQLGMAMLVRMDLESGTLYLTTASVDLEHDGATWIGGRQLGVEDISDQGGELQALRFTLSGVPSEMLALALAEPIQGRPVSVRLVLLNPDTFAIGADLPLWRGTLDQMPVRHGGAQSVITVTAEHRGIQFARPKPSRYTDAEQRRLHPGDRALEYLVSQSQHQDIWPSAEFFKQ